MPTTPVLVFQSADAAYLAWRAGNPSGWVANVSQSLGGQFIKIHRPACGKSAEFTHARHEQPLTGGKYAKVAASTIEALCAWRAARMLPVPPQSRCRLCCANEPLPVTFESLAPDQVEEAGLLLLQVGPVVRPRGLEHPARVTTATQGYLTSPAVRAWVLQRAHGVCESCAQAAPFVTTDGRPFLEIHHVTPLAEGGPDVPGNCAALCPNCHRRMHHGASSALLASVLRAHVAKAEADSQGRTPRGRSP